MIAKGKIIKDFVLIIYILFVNLYSFAASPGAVSGSFLNYSPSARGSGMSDAFSSISDDAYASYYNPAGLVGIERFELGATYNKSFQDISNQFFSVAYPKRIGEVFSLSYSGFSYGDIQGYDANGYKTKNIDTGDKYLAFSYGRAFTKDEIERSVLSGGMNLKYISEKLDNVSANAFAIDLGAVYSLRPDKYWLSEIPAQEFKFSAVLRNFGSGLKFDKESYPLPRALVLGASWHSYPWGSHRLILGMDNVISNYDKFAINLGAEYFMFELVGVRVGFTTQKDIGSKINFGIGFKLSFVDIDYSMTPFGELGNMQKIAVMARFGNIKALQPLKGEVARIEKAKLIAPKEKIEKLQLFASDFIKLAEKNIQERDYVKAVENINKAFNLEPSLKQDKWGKIEKNLVALNSAMEFGKRPEKLEILKQKNEQSELAFKTISAFINGENQKAYLLAHITYGTNVKGPVIYEELLNSICDILRLSVRKEEILPLKSWVNQKLKRMANYFYVRQFDMVIREGEEIILIDENNYLAWTRLCSAYFMLGDKDKAKKAYFKALEINPNDKVTEKFIEMQGWK